MVGHPEIARVARTGLGPGSRHPNWNAVQEFRSRSIKVASAFIGSNSSCFRLSSRLFRSCEEISKLSQFCDELRSKMFVGRQPAEYRSFIVCAPCKPQTSCQRMEESGFPYRIARDDRSNVIVRAKSYKTLEFS